MNLSNLPNISIPVQQPTTKKKNTLQKIDMIRINGD